MKTMRDLIGDALSDALEIIAEHEELCRALGLTGKVNTLEVSRILGEALEKADRKTIRPLFQLLCATNIMGSLKACADSKDGEDTRGAYLAPFWHGVLRCERWMDEDRLLSMYKDSHNREFAATIGGKKRQSKEGEVVERLVPAVRDAVVVAKRASLMKACKTALKNEGYKADRIINALALKVVEPELNEAHDLADKLWGEGDPGSTIVMRDQMFESFFVRPKIQLCGKGKELIKDALRKKMNDLSGKKYPDRKFGDKGVKLEGIQ